jgi:hypothetical protein
MQPLECGGSSHRLLPAVHTANCKGRSKKRGRSSTVFLLPPLAHLPNEATAVGVATARHIVTLAAFPYEPEVEGGGCCHRTPKEIGKRIVERYTHAGIFFDSYARNSS